MIRKGAAWLPSCRANFLSYERTAQTVPSEELTSTRLRLRVRAFHKIDSLCLRHSCSLLGLMDAIPCPRGSKRRTWWPTEEQCISPMWACELSANAILVEMKIHSPKSLERLIQKQESSVLKDRAYPNIAWVMFTSVIKRQIWYWAGDLGLVREGSGWRASRVWCQSKKLCTYS